MNGLHDLLEKLKKLEEAAAAPTEFKPNYYHKSNWGTTTPLMMTDPGVFWYMGTATNDDGSTIRGGGGRQAIQRWYGNTENRSAINPASVDGKIVNGAPGPEFPEGVTWRTDLATADKAKADAQNAQKVSSANTGGASSALVQNREQLAPGTVASETGSDGVTYGVDANGQRTYKLDTQQQKWVKLPTPVPAEQGELGAQAKPVVAVNNAPDYSSQFKASPDGSISTQAQSGKLTTMGGDATVGTVPSVSQGSSAEVPAEITANLARVKQIISGMKEGIRFKSRIGHALLESFDLKLNEDATADLAELNKIWPSCVKWAEANPSTAEAKEIEGLRGQVTKWQASVQSSTVGKAPAPLVIPGVDTVANIAAQVSAVKGAEVPVKAGGYDGANQAAPDAEKKKETVLPQAVQDLAAANKIDNANKISVGQVITLADGKTKYTIVAGDTLADIAAGKFRGVDPTKTAEYNPAKDSQLANASLGNGDAAKVAQSSTAKSPGARPSIGYAAQLEWDRANKEKFNVDGSAKDGSVAPPRPTGLFATYNATAEWDQKFAGKFDPKTGQKVGDGATATISGDAAKEVPKTRYKTPEEYDKEIARFSSKYDMKLKGNQQYIANLEAEKAQLATASVKPASTTGDITSPDRPGLDPKKGKPEVYDRQKQLAALGAKMKDGTTPLGLDGVNGNDTIAAEKEFGHLIVDPKTTIVVNGAPRVVNANDIKSIQSWIKAVKEKRKKMEEVPPVYMDIVKKQSAIKESTGYTNEELSRILSLVHHR